MDSPCDNLFSNLCGGNLGDYSWNDRVDVSSYLNDNYPCNHDDH